MGFLTQAIGSVFDPVALFGYIAAGVALKKLWMALASGLIWGTAMEFLTFVVTSAAQIDYAGELFPQRLVGAALATLIVWSIATVLRQFPDASNPHQ